ncbi:hypothetical protein OAK30_02940 [Candidatus Nitrosopelagicus sp.]|nr:hypothetical protein [Candidatus Nitrosopelagicus sp.]
MTSKMFAGRYYKSNEMLEQYKEEKRKIKEIRMWLNSKFQNLSIIFHTEPSVFSLAYDNVLKRDSFYTDDIFIKHDNFEREDCEMDYETILDMTEIVHVGFAKVITFIPGIMAYFVDTGHSIHVLKTPKIRHDDEFRLHSTNSAAVSWTREKFYCIHGIKFESKEFWKIVNRTMPPEIIIQLTNIEQRRVATQIYGIELLMTSLNKKLIDRSSRGNELYEIDLGTRPEWWWKGIKFTGLVLKYSCPSTGRIYFSGIPEVDNNEQRIKSADQAMAWKFGLSEEEYSRLTIEA